MKNIFNWIVRSSKNPTEVSLTVKSFLVMVVPFVVPLTGLLHLNVTNEQALQFVDAVTLLTQTVFALIGATGVVIGLARKFVK